MSTSSIDWQACLSQDLSLLAKPAAHQSLTCARLGAAALDCMALAQNTPFTSLVALAGAAGMAMLLGAVL